LSLGKTMVSPRFFSLNSTFFRSTQTVPRLVPVLRTAGLLRPVDSFSAIRGMLRSFCRGFKGEALVVAQSFFLASRRRSVTASGRSVTRGLGCSVSSDALKRSGLWKREVWYLELPSERPLPLDPCRLKWADVPCGWELVPLGRSIRTRRRQRLASERFYDLLVAGAWSGDFKSQASSLSEYRSRVQGSGGETQWRKWRAIARRARTHRGLPIVLRRTIGSGVRFAYGLSVERVARRGVNEFAATAQEFWLCSRNLWSWLESDHPRVGKVWAEKGVARCRPLTFVKSQ